MYIHVNSLSKSIDVTKEIVLKIWTDILLKIKSCLHEQSLIYQRQPGIVLAVNCSCTSIGN